MKTAAKPPDATSSERADWDAADQLLKAYPTKYGSLNWIAARPLIAGLNHFFSLGAGSLVNDLRNHWVARQPQVLPDRLVPMTSTSSWVVIGDTGEQDGSQYVVSRALSEACRGDVAGVAEPGFVVIVSDVIYPAGDVEDYRFAVYNPYRLAEAGAPMAAGFDPEDLDPDDFTIRKPIYALPGNHDWYDGLSGFMYHFADQAPLETQAYGRSGRNPLQWLCRIMWRRPRAAGELTRTAHQASPLTRGGPDQPGPYFAIDTEHLLLVCIDTGIDGTLGAEQLGWLEQVSLQDKAKVLLTGKPLVVNRKLAEEQRPVWDLVHEPANRYVATIGGDIHNFQMYRRKQELDRDPASNGTAEEAGWAEQSAHWPAVHLVAGGGGAFMHASHVHHSVAQEDLSATEASRPEMTGVYASPPALTFPNTPQSLRFYAARLIGGVSRAMVNLTVMLAAVAVGGVVNHLGWSANLALLTISLGAGLLVLAVVVRTFTREAERQSRLPRFVVTWLGAPGVGLLVAGLTYRLDPRHAGAFLLAVAGLALWLSLVSAGARDSRWWVGTSETFEPPHHVRFLIGLVALSAVLALVQVAVLDPQHRLGWLVPACAFLVLGVVGWFVRTRMSTWQVWSSRLLPGLLVVVTALVVSQTASGAGLTRTFWSALGGGVIGLAAVAVAAGGAVLTLSLLIGLALRGPSRSWSLAWGRSAKVTWYCWNALLVGATIGWAWLCRPGPASRVLFGPAAFGLPAAVVALVSTLMAVDWLRRRRPTSYVWFVLLASIVTAVVGLVFWDRLWWVRVIVAAVVVIFALLVCATVVHLSFLGAYKLARGSYREIIDVGTDESALEALMPDDDVYRVFTQRAKNEAPTGGLNLKPLLFWIRMTAPGLSQPGGPLQRLVSELSSSDVPPFYKHFLSFSTSESEDGRTTLVVKLHKVFGLRKEDPLQVAMISWTSSADGNLDITADELAFDAFA